MIVQANNKMGTGLQVILTRNSIAFNKNYFNKDIQPTSTVSLNGNIGPNSTKTVNLNLQLPKEPTPKQPLGLTVQMAARSIRTNSAKPPVTMFATQIPDEIYFDNNNASRLSDMNSFLGEWRSITNINIKTMSKY